MKTNARAKERKREREREREKREEKKKRGETTKEERNKERKIAGNYLTSRSAKRILGLLLLADAKARLAGQKLSHKERYLLAEKEAAPEWRIRIE